MPGEGIDGRIRSQLELCRIRLRLSRERRYALHLQLLDMGKREDAPLLHDRNGSLISHPKIAPRSIRSLRTS